MTNIFKITKAFSDRNRIKILKMLTTGTQNVGDVANKLNIEENLASHHLRVLFSLGLLKNSKRGRQVFYDLNKAKIITLLKDLNKNEFFRDVIQEALEEK